MSNLVELLRSKHGHMHVTEAADEIERLHKLIAPFARQCSYGTVLLRDDEIDALKAEATKHTPPP